LWSWWTRFKKYLLLEFISKEQNLAIDWQAALNKPLVVVAHPLGKRYARLVFDGRLWYRGAQQQPVCWILSSITGRLTGEKDDISQLPVQNLGPNAAKLTPLWQLLNLATPFPDPQTWQELNHRTEGIAVSICYGKSVKCIEKGTNIILEAAADKWYEIVYRDQPHPRDLPAWLELEDVDEKKEEKKEDPCQTNRSTSVSISQSSLNLAYSLGVVSSQEHAALSQCLGQTVASLAVHTDKEGHLWHIFYRLVLTTMAKTQSIEIGWEIPC
jgi:hypothetical protein